MLLQDSREQWHGLSEWTPQCSLGLPRTPPLRLGTARGPVSRFPFPSLRSSSMCQSWSKMKFPHGASVPPYFAFWLRDVRSGEQSWEEGAGLGRAAVMGAGWDVGTGRAEGLSRSSYRFPRGPFSLTQGRGTTRPLGWLSSGQGLVPHQCPVVLFGPSPL